jgi:hypothetical protein
MNVVIDLADECLLVSRHDTNSKVKKAEWRDLVVLESPKPPENGPRVQGNG